CRSVFVGAAGLGYAGPGVLVCMAHSRDRAPHRPHWSTDMSIEVRNLHKQFGNFTALQDVSLKFPDGKLTALLGPSGCGKTTLLRIVAGLEHPDSGQVLLDNESATERHVRERQVGFVFQHYALFKHMSVFENIAFGLRVRP